MMPLANLTGDVEQMANYAGQSVGLVHETAPAAEIVRRVMDQAKSVLSLAAGEGWG